MSKPIRIHNHEKLMLIDFSYYILHRYYALQSWCKISKNTLSEEEMLHRFHQKFQPQFLQLIKQYDVLPENVIFVGDCKRDTIWRRQLDSEYKANRDAISKTHNIPLSFFELMYETVIPEITNQYNNQFVCFDEMEADDIISVICTECDDINIIIISNDNDYLQLNTSNIQIYNLKSLNICSRGTGHANKDLQLKILTGDVSDNIKSVCPKRIATMLVETDPCELELYIENNGLKSKYNHNRSLIDFSMIPKKYSDLVVSSLEKCNR